MNREAGCELIPEVRRDVRVKAYVFDDGCRKQPFGAWGNLYIMDHPTTGWVDKITNPYGEGVLYQTGRVARILPDGSLDLLENGGRTVMQESITGRNFLDLARLERILLEYEGIDEAKAYVRYAEENKTILEAEICGAAEPDRESLTGYLQENCEKALIPESIRFVRKAG